MDNSIMQNHIIKVNKTMIGIFIILTALDIIFTIQYRITVLLAGVVVQLILIAFLSVSIKKNKYERVLAYIASIAISIIVTSVISDVNNIYEILIPVSMATLYLDNKLFIICSILANVGVFLRLLFANLISANFFITLLLVDLSIFIMFFICKWGMDLIKSAMSGNVQLGKTIDIVKANSITLNTGITNCNSSLQIVKEINDNMTSSLQEITKGVVVQTESVTNISGMMGEADEKTSEINMLSKQLADVSTRTMDVVLEGSQKINQMDKQMNIINLAVSKSFSTVQELNNSMDEVNKLLSGISQISKQTNLLALNAAIEAARAGASGKGFAVVADEVRNLAKQSANLVTQIDQIVIRIKDNTKNVLNEVNNGLIAAQEGSTIVDSVNESFDKINLSFKDIDKYISNEHDKIENIAELFSQISGESESIASISEEHAASTEELMSTAEEHNANIENICNLIQEIQSASDNMQSIIKQ